MDNFTPIGESYASLFQRLRHRGMITPLLGYIPDPYSKNFDPNVWSAYQSDVQGHNTEDCRTLKKKIEKMIQDKLIVVQNIGPSTIPQSSSLARGTAQYVGGNEFSMGIQNLFVEGNMSDSGGSSCHADM
ncbi:hypothetical protein P3L10_021795 [Capsicum annuum]